MNDWTGGRQAKNFPSRCFQGNIRNLLVATPVPSGDRPHPLVLNFDIVVARG
jgi:hypothetical protein